MEADNTGLHLKKVKKMSRILNLQRIDISESDSVGFFDSTQSNGCSSQTVGCTTVTQPAFGEDLF